MRPKYDGESQIRLAEIAGRIPISLAVNHPPRDLYRDLAIMAEAIFQIMDQLWDKNNTNRK